MDIPQLSVEENQILTDGFKEDEISEAIDQKEYTKAPGPYGFPAEFYKSCWDIIRKDLMAMFLQLQHGGLPLYKLKLWGDYPYT